MSLVIKRYGLIFPLYSEETFCVTEKLFLRHFKREWMLFIIFVILVFAKNKTAQS